MKKYNKFLLVAPMIITALVGCGGGKGGDDGKIHIRFLQNTDKDNYTPILVRAAEAFNNDETVNPGKKIVVDASQESGSYDALLTKTRDAISTDGYCDIFYGYPDSVQVLKKYNIVYNLDSFINDPEIGLTPEELADIVPAYLQEGKNYPEEGTYSMPFSKSTEVMYYNKQIIGIDLSSIDPTINGGNPITHNYINNLTWEDLFEHLCPALVTYNNGLPAENKLIIPEGGKEDGKKCVFAYDSDSNFFITLAKQYGYDYTAINEQKKGEILFDNENMAGLMVKLSQAYAAGYLHTQGTYSTYTSNLFNAKASVFTVSSTAGAKNTYNSLFETVPAKIPHPAAAGSKAYTISQGPSIAILNHGSLERGQAAWKFYAYFLRKYSTNWAVNTGYLPVTQSAYESDAWQEACSTEGLNIGTKEYNIAKTYGYIGQVSNLLFDSPVFDQSAAARTQAGSALTQCILQSGLTVDAAMSILRTCKNKAMNG